MTTLTKILMDIKFKCLKYKAQSKVLVDTKSSINFVQLSFAINKSSKIFKIFLLKGKL